MIKFVISESTALVAAVLWCLLVLSVSRRFGVHWRFGRPMLQHSAVVRSSPARWIVIAGVLMFGCGLAIAATVSDYISWKFSPREYPTLNLRYVFTRWIFCVMFGVTVAGLLRRRYRNRLMPR